VAKKKVTSKKKRDRRVDDDGFLLAPHEIDSDHWWYEDKAGIDVYAHFAPGVSCGVTQTRISWAQLRAALKRKDSSPTKKKEGA